MDQTDQLPYIEFGKRLRALRLLAGIPTQRELADRLADVGLVYEHTYVSHWETGRRCPPPETLIGLVRVLVAGGGIQEVESANQLLALANMRNLNETEVAEIFGATPPEAPLGRVGPRPRRLQEVGADESGGPDVENVADLALPEHAGRLLRGMFPDHRRVVVKKDLGHYGDEDRLFLVRPIGEAGAELPCVVRFGPAHLLQKEGQAYQDHIRDRLGAAAVVKGVALLPDGTMGGLCYALSQSALDVERLDEYCQRASPEEGLPVVERLLRELGTLLGQSRARPEFSWRAGYAPLLPADLVLEPGSALSTAEPYTVTPDGLGGLRLEPGSPVRLEGFVVAEIDRQGRPTALTGPGSSGRVVLRPAAGAPERQVGDAVGPLEGLVLETRRSRLWAKAAQVVGRQADLAHDTILLANGEIVPNPLPALPGVLDQRRDVWVASIHGDLAPKNVLVNPGTGSVRLIGFSQARLGHVLHDFFRLEVGMVLGPLAEGLAAQALPPGPTVFDFYLRLHCAAFGGDDVFTSRPFPDPLEKVFALLRRVRLAARDWLYAGDFAEYYQGLLVHLLGGVGSDEFEEEPKASLSRQVAFWGATMAARFLESSPSCERLVAGPESPPATIVEIRPEVKVVRRGSDRLIPARFGMPLYRGDVVSTYVDAGARVQCENGLLFEVAAERNKVVECQDDSDGPGLARLSRALKDQMASLAEVLGLAWAAVELSVEAAPEPLLLTPRNSLVAEARPSFRWRPVRGAAGYHLCLRTPEGRTWQRETDRTELAYPDDAPPLSSGSVYTVTLEPRPGPGVVDVTQVRLLDGAALTRLAEAEKEVQRLPLDETAKTYLLIRLYRGRHLWARAIERMEWLIGVEGAGSPYLRQQLGDLYFQVGLCDRATRAYQAALDAAGAEAFARSLVHLRLAWAALARSDVEQALAHLGLISAAELSQAVTRLRERMAQTQPEPPVYQGPRVLIDYVRFLAENAVPRLADEIGRIPDAFLERLKGWGQFELKPEMASARLGQGGTAEALEVLAATYVTTLALIETLSPADVAEQARTGRLPDTLRRVAQRQAQEGVGLDPDQARAFAERYAVLVGHAPDLLGEMVG